MKKYHILFIICMLFVGGALNIASTDNYVEPDSISVHKLIWKTNSVNVNVNITGFDRASFTVLTVNGGRRRAFTFGRVSDIVLNSTYPTDVIEILIFDWDNNILGRKILYKGNVDNE